MDSNFRVFVWIVMFSGCNSMAETIKEVLCLQPSVKSKVEVVVPPPLLKRTPTFPKTTEDSLSRFNQPARKLLEFQPKALPLFIPGSDAKKINNLVNAMAVSPPVQQKDLSAQLDRILTSADFRAEMDPRFQLLRPQDFQPMHGLKLGGTTLTSNRLYTSGIMAGEENNYRNSSLDTKAFCPACTGVDPIGGGKQIDMMPKGTLTSFPLYPRSATADTRCSKALSNFEIASSKAADKMPPGFSGPEDFLRWHYFYATPAQTVDAVIQDALTKARAYSAACHKPAAEVLSAAAAPALPVGAIGVGSTKLYRRTCSALQVSPEEILTARHCVAVEQQLGRLTEVSTAELRKYWYEQDSGKAVRYQICSVAAPASRGPFNEVSDYIVLKIAKTQTPPAKIFLSEKPVMPGDYLYLPGLNIAEEQKDVFTASATGVEGCRATAVTETCIVHGCQAHPGTSGAPIFVSRQQEGLTRLELAGIHTTGAADAVPKFCGAKSAPGFVYVKNAGIPLEKFKAFLPKE